MQIPSDSIELTSQFPVTLQKTDQSGERFRGLLLGQVSKDRMLISVTQSTGMEINDRIIVRSVQSGKAFGFETNIREIVISPVELYFVDPPENIEVISLRKTDRLNVFIPTEVRMSGNTGGGDTLLLKGTMLDISAGGCRIYTKRHISSESILHLTFNLPGEKAFFAVSGVVIDIATNGNLFSQRVKFHQSDKNLGDLNEIHRWVNQNLIFADI